MLARLLKQNLDRQLRGNPGCKGGFVDARGPKQIKLCGVYTFLHTRTRAFPKLSKRAYRARRRKKTSAAAAGRRPCGTKASNKRIGSYFHRQVHHALVCALNVAKKKPIECTCPEGPTTALVRKTSPVYAMVQSAALALRELELVPLCGEKIVADPAIRLGTRIDLLTARFHDMTKFVLVSWKTTGMCPFSQTSPSSFDSVMKRVSKQDSSEDITAREHLAQVVCELHLLCDEHQLAVDGAVIIYLFPGQESRYRAVWIRDDCVRNGGYRAAWAWLYKQHQDAAAAAAAAGAPQSTEKATEKKK